jgi:hypothetical protein
MLSHSNELGQSETVSERHRPQRGEIHTAE